MESRKILYNTLLGEAYWHVNKSLTKKFGLEAALLLSDLLSKEKYFFIRGDLQKTDGWFFNQQSQIENDTTLTPHKQRKALEILKGAGVIETKLKGIPPLQYYKINHSQILKSLTYVDKKNQEHNNNKDNNTIINNSIGSPSDPNVNKNKNSLIDKGVKVSETAIIKYSSLIDRWNKIEKATTHDIKKPSKTLKKIVTLFQQLEAGSFFRYTGIDAKWCKDNNVPEEWAREGKQFTKQEIAKGIKHMSQQFKTGYWPYTEEQKKKLPRSLAESLYNPFGGCASVFLKALANPPKKVEPLPENKYPEALQIYCDEFFGKPFEDFSKQHQRSLLKDVNQIMDWHQGQAETLCPIYGDTSFSTYFGTVKKPLTFIKTHINFLKNKNGIYTNKEPYHQNFKPAPSMIQFEGNRWNRFVDDFLKVHGFRINPSEKEIEKLKIIYKAS